MDKAKKHMEICNKLNEIYKAKNHDYGDSFGESFKEDGLIMAKIRLNDKFKRFKSLILCEGHVKEESIIDTLMDMANYAIMTVIELESKEAK